MFHMFHDSNLLQSVVVGVLFLGIAAAFFLAKY
jgi:hypothetical protein